MGRASLFKTWSDWTKWTLFVLSGFGFAFAAFYFTALDKKPKPPNDPSFWDVCTWAATCNDPVVYGLGLFAALGAAASLFQLFGPKPAGEKLVRKLFGELQGLLRRSFAAADQQQARRHGADLAGHQRTQAEVAELDRKIAALTALVEKTNPQTAGPMNETLTTLGQSADPADNAIAEAAVAGNYDAAFDALIVEAEASKKRNAERYRQAARLIAPFSPSKALEAYKQATELDPTDVWSWIELGRLRVHYDSLAAARACFGNALQQVRDELDRAALHDELGNLLMAEGQLTDARMEYEAGLAIAERLAAAEPGNAGWPRNLSVSFEKLGNVEVSAGNLGQARQRFEASLAIRERLAAAEPGNAGWQRDLSVSHAKLAQLAEQAGDRQEALAGFLRAEAIIVALAARLPDHPGFAQDLKMVHRDIAWIGGGGPEEAA